MGRDHLYIIQMAVTGDFKVGRSNDVTRRLGELQTGCPHRLRILLVAKGLGHREKAVHRALHPFRTRYGKGEWFTERGIGSIPVDLWNMVELSVLEDPDWWKSGRGQTFGTKVVHPYHRSTPRLDDRERRVVACAPVLRPSKASPGVDRDREAGPENRKDDDQVAEARERREGGLVEEVAHDLFAFLGLDEPGERSSSRAE